MNDNTYIKTGLVLVFSIGYAIVRYHIFGPVDAAHIPSYLVNKGVSFAAVFYLLFSAFYRYQNNVIEARYWGKVSLIFMCFHVFLSWSIWSPGYYEAFYAKADWSALTDKMNLKGELALLTGAIGSVVYFMISSKKPKSITLLMSIAVVMVCLHVAVMGFFGWVPGNWHGGLPPITLLSFLVALPSLWFLLIRQPK